MAEAARKAAEESARKALEAAAAAKKEQQRVEKELSGLRSKQIKETQAPAEVPATVSYITPPDVQKELDELRERDRQRKAADTETAVTMKREGAEYTFRVLYDQFRGQFDKLQAALGQMSPETRERYTAALIEALHMMEKTWTVRE